MKSRKYISAIGLPSKRTSPRSNAHKGIIIGLAASLLLYGAPFAHAATTPSLGAAEAYGVLADTYTNTSAATTINGAVGFTTGPAQAPLGTHAYYGNTAPYATAGIDQNTALTALAQPCTFTFPSPIVDLSTDGGFGGIYTPGVYCSTGAMSIGGALTLNGNGTYIFRADGALTSVDGSVVALTGSASACDIFWTPTGSTTLGANTIFAGTVIDGSAITVGANTSWLGRALAYAGTVTTGNTVTITTPTCAVTSSSTITEGNQPLRRPLISVTKIPSPLALPGPGSVTYTYEISNPGLYTMDNVTLTDNKCSAMKYSTGDSNGDSLLQNTEIWTYKCTSWLTEDTQNEATATGYANGLPATDIAYANVNVGSELPAPLIHVIKKPDSFLLPFGGGQVTYTYEVSNPGTTSLYYIQVTDDKCNNVVYSSGDLDGTNTLDIHETWIYKCETALDLTTTNTVTVTGNANNVTATDIANATVVVSPRPAVEALPVSHPSNNASSEPAPLTPQVTPQVTAQVPLLPKAGVGPNSNTLWEINAFSLFITIVSIVSSHKITDLFSGKK